MIILDASVVVDLLLQAPDAERVMTRVLSGDSLHAPHLLDIEVAQVFRRHATAGVLDPDRGLRALQLLQAFPMTRYDHGPMLPRIWALRNNLTAYDAAYVSLAEALGGCLLTRDRRLAAAPGHGARIEVI